MAEVCDLPAGAIDDIKNFLPEGYFSDEGGVAIERGNVLKDNYILKLVGYRRGTAASNILTYYGVVIPDPSILPDQGETNGSWNFRRAARVAMLIGIDGGAYDPTITGNEIAGAVGTWHLPINGLIKTEDIDIPTYVAITGTDVFQPEIDVPDVRIGLPEHWDLALHDATAYGKFTAGAPDGCYRTEMNGGQRAAVYNSASGIFEIRPDHIYEPSATCLPAFYVESGDDGAAATGNVHVLNDLTVGRDWTGANAGKAAIRFDKDGMIVFEKAEVSDPQSSHNINYVLDPKYTSVMNDIKLMSRGGASLSDILPNYILKTRKDWSCTIAEGRPCQLADDTTISPDKAHCWCGDSAALDQESILMPKCPKGYKRALLVTPQNFAGGYRQHAEAAINSTGDPDTSKVTSHTHNIPVAYHLITDVTVFQPVIHLAQTKPSGINDDTRNEGGTWTLSLGYKSPWRSNQINDPNGVKENGNRLYQPQTIDVVIETYCVFDPTNIDWNSDGTADGADNSPDKNRTMDADTCGRIKAQSVCENMGCEWESNACKHKS